MIRVGRDAVWNVLRLYGIGGRLANGRVIGALMDCVLNSKVTYVNSKACVRVGNEV